MLTSIQTVAHSVSIILFQTCNYHVDFFVLRVMIYWSCAYLLAILLVGTLRTMDNEEECTLNCMKLSMVDSCSDPCIVYDYYHRKDTLAGNAMLIRFVEVMFLVGIRCIAICFTHMRRSEYYNFKRKSSPVGGMASPEEGESDSLLLSGSV